MSTIEPGEPLHLVTLDQYETMVNAGVLPEEARIQLIDGLLVQKKRRTSIAVTGDELCGDALGRVVPAGWHVRAAKPIRIPSQASKPEPDRCVARGGIRDYLQRSPEPADIALVVEISDSSLSEDPKQAAIYYGGGIPTYWIVNLIDRQVEVYSDPGPGGYRVRHDYRESDSVPVIIDGHQIGTVAVRDILP
jgi:Uma2 family endonuclease